MIECTLAEVVCGEEGRRGGGEGREEEGERGRDVKINELSA